MNNGIVILEIFLTEFYRYELVKIFCGVEGCRNVEIRHSSAFSQSLPLLLDLQPPIRHYCSRSLTLPCSTAIPVEIQSQNSCLI